MTRSPARRAARTWTWVALVAIATLGLPPGAVAAAAPAQGTKPSAAAPAQGAKPPAAAPARGAKPSAAAPAPGAKPPAASRPPAKKSASALAGRTVKELARDARSLEDLGLYAQAAEQLAELRGRVPRDADLELSLALDHARSGRPDSAAAILWSPPLTAAVNDTGPLSRYQEYAWPREGGWLTGNFGGWHWYVARARAELAFAQRRWHDGYDASLIATRARPLSGKDWLIRSLLAARAGADDDARQSALMAVTLDPTLPEAQYAHGLWEWRAGRRSAAAERFRWAVELDSTYRPAALALARVRLPLPPDSLPGELLTGVRRVALLASPVGPKIEEFAQMDQPAAILSQVQVVLPDSLRDRWKTIRLTPVVLVDESGRVVLNDLTWTHPMPGIESLTGTIMASLRQWRFRPAIKDGRPHRVWAAVDVSVNPGGPP